MTKKPFQGTGTAMITPFRADGSLDEKALRRLVDFQIDGSVDMLLPCGTTGEGGTLTGNNIVRMKEGSSVADQPAVGAIVSILPGRNGAEYLREDQFIPGLLG